MGMDGHDAIYRKKADELSRQPFDGHYNNEVLAVDDPHRGLSGFEGEEHIGRRESSDTVS